MRLRTLIVLVASVYTVCNCQQTNGESKCNFAALFFLSFACVFFLLFTCLLATAKGRIWTHVTHLVKRPYRRTLQGKGRMNHILSRFGVDESFRTSFNGIERVP